MARIVIGSKRRVGGGRCARVFVRYFSLTFFQGFLGAIDDVSRSTR